MDQMVLTVQQWLNQTYTGVDNWTPVTEDGITGSETVNALLEALQIEEGITDLSPNFGAETTANFTPIQYTDGTTVSNKNYILQGGFWCKGIGPGAWNGIFDDNTEQTVKTFQADAGLTQDGIVTAMLMKALLNMDAFVLVSGGDSNIREIQQSLNAKYNAYFGLIACDGVYERSTNTALIYALQAEEGLSTSIANGVFGPTTTADCPTLQYGDSGNFVYILQWALYCNGDNPNGFDGIFGNGVKSAVTSFQTFMGLQADGIAGVETIEALLTSAGDTSRSAEACDTATILTAEMAQELSTAGYQYVGRYLTGTVGTPPVSKALTSDELQIILNAGLKVFLIFEDGGDEASYFTESQGTSDANLAMTTARQLGIPQGAVIYFAVDFDAMESDVTNNILPYFNAIKETFSNDLYSGYKIGIYGSRNPCTQVSDAGYAEFSFVADMSTGYSGNLGYAMPANWSFDQFVTKSLDSPRLSIDADSYSGHDAAVSSVATQQQIQDARQTIINNLSQDVLPLLKQLPTTGIELDQSYSLEPIPGIIVGFSASATITAPGAGYTSFTVSNGEITSEFGDGLVTLGASQDQVDQCTQFTASIAQKMGDGEVSLQIKSNLLESFEVIFKLDYPAIAVVDGFDTTLAIEITIGWLYSDPNLTGAPTVPDVSPIIEDVAIGVGIGVLVLGVVCALAFLPAEILVATAVIGVEGFVDDVETFLSAA